MPTLPSPASPSTRRLVSSLARGSLAQDAWVIRTKYPVSEYLLFVCRTALQGTSSLAMMTVRPVTRQRYSYERNRLRLTKNSTGFPAGINAAATFSRRLMRARGVALAEEFRAKGVKSVSSGPAFSVTTDVLLSLPRSLVPSFPRFLCQPASFSDLPWTLCVTQRPVVHGRGKR